MKSRVPEWFKRRLDLIIERGGSWDHMETRAINLAKANKIEYNTTSIIRDHFNYRKKSNPLNFHKLTVTNDGIYNPEERVCQCGNTFLRNKSFPLDSMLYSFFELRHYDIDYLCEVCLSELMDKLDREDVNKLADDWRSRVVNGID